VRTYDRFLELPKRTRQDILQLATIQTENKQRQMQNLARDLLQTRFDPKHIRNILLVDNIVATNSFTYYHERDTLPPSDHESRRALYVQAARFNHSCVPNASWLSHEGSSDMLVLSNHGISEGEEITISYVPSDRPRAWRMAYLCDAWRFTCNCPACDTSHPESRPYEQLLSRIAQVNRTAFWDKDSRLRTDQKWTYKELESASQKARTRIELYHRHPALRSTLHSWYVLFPSILSI